MTENVTLEIRLEMLLDPDDADTLQELMDARNDPSEDRSSYELEQEMDAIVGNYIDMASIHDCVKFDLI